MIVKDFDNNKAIFSIKNISKITKHGLHSAFCQSGKYLIDTSKKEIKDKSKKTGKIYIKRINRRKVKHQASAPGEYPANFTGNLRKSVGYQIAGANRLDFGAGGRNTKVNYAKWLEKGTSKMAKRPFLAPSISENSRNIENAIIAEIEKGFNKIS